MSRRVFIAGQNHRRDVDLAICQLPQKEIRYTHFAAGADQQVYVRQASGVKIVLDVRVIDAFDRIAAIDGLPGGAPASLDDLGTAAVIQSHAENGSRIFSGLIDGPGQFFLHAFGEPRYVSDRLEPDIIRSDLVHLAADITFEHRHQAGDFGLRPLPVLGGERVKRYGLDLQTRTRI
ncbi:MAG: hypothetical protein IPM25_04040 [Chloracidobacterium sp.]|nr:hypothetical protein [Chloracidobacterium sp.]